MRTKHRATIIIAATLRAIIGSMALACLFASCESSVVEDLYAHQRAYWRFTPVTALSPLQAALNAPGQFCQVSINLQGTHYVAQSADGRTTANYPLTALEAYGRAEWVSGLIIGTPSVPNMNMQYQPVAYDLVCPNCNELDGITRTLRFAGTEELLCPRCARHYNLLTDGSVQAGPKGKRLYRYHISYAPAQDLVMVIN